LRIDLRKTLFILPNLFTLSSLFCGLYAVMLCLGEPNDDRFYRSAILIVFAIFFDMIDGRVARLTRTASDFGVQIDSLADLVSFGVAPSILIYRWSLLESGALGVVASFSFAASGALRLARFNVLSARASDGGAKPGPYTVGLPIPGAAGLLVSLVVANHAAGGHLEGARALLMAVLVVLALLMVSTIRFRSFKDLKLSWRTAALVFFAVGSSIVLAARFRPAFVLVWLLGCYILIGLSEAAWGLARAAGRRRTRR
jgi:CDP-diacylglycerol--serine O-phosphatidyltransferase